MIWLELRCDERMARRCVANVGGAPGLLAEANLADITKTIAMLKIEARKEGWKIFAGECVCPACRKEPRP